MLVQYISDIHLEFLNSNNVKKISEKILPIASILILSGDIGNPYKMLYKIFLRNMSRKFEKIFLICGNHEYYENYINETKIQVDKVCKEFDNIVFLDNSSYEYNNYLFIGTTLWSKVTNDAYEINDTISINNFTPSDYNILHNNAKEFLLSTLKNTDKDVIIITHHLPSLSLIHEQYLNDDDMLINQWFASDCDDVFMNNSTKIKAWFYGHTHMAQIKNIHNVTTYCNPLGYKNENTNIEYVKTCII